jgi:nucleoside-diphosphate-sugar epimerase
MPTTSPVILIAGCGYLGREIASRCLSRGWRVAGLTRTDESASIPERAGVEMFTADIGDRDALLTVRGKLPTVAMVVHAASSSRGGPDAYQRVFIEGLANLHAVFAPRRLLFTSSTSVYGQTDGARVDESAPTTPLSATSRILLDAEKLVLANGGIVARLAGIYGPGRCVVLRKFLDGSAVIEDGGSRILNHIHRDDAATAMLTLLEAQTAHGIYNVADDCPLDQLSVYKDFARQFDLPLPPAGPRPLGRKRGWTSKQVDNSRLRAMGWSPRFPSLTDALRDDPRLIPSIASTL